MHSRIFELTKEPVEKENRMTESDLFSSWFVGSIADYVSDDVDRKEDIHWLIHAFNPDFIKVVGQKSITFKEGFKKDYYKKRLNELKSKVAEMTIDEFLEKYKVYEINKLLEEKYTFYVYDDHQDLMSLDDFLRDLEENRPYYIGGVVDYHF